MSTRLGSLFTGAAGLDMAVEAVLGTTTAWHCEVDPAASRVLAHRFPDVPNLGDVTTVDWAAVEPVDVLCGGSPCQDVSHAGKRAGMRAGTRSGLWASMCDAIDALRPQFVVWENVRGVLSAEADSALEPCPGCVGDGSGVALRALGRVLGDLADLGYDARWHGLRAADVGAPHGRFRVFVVATDADSERLARGESATPRRSEQADDLSGLRFVAADTQNVGHERSRPTRAGWTRPEDSRGPVADSTGDGWDEGWPESAGVVGGSDAAERGATTPDTDRNALRIESVTESGRGRQTIAGHPRSDACGPVSRADVFAGRWCACETAADANCGRLQGGVGWLEPVRRDIDGRSGADVAWGQYEPAIRRWEQRLGRLAPAPTETGAKGGQRLSPRFVEWMMGWPAGWVTDVPGITRNDALRICGNGVVPNQAAEAIRRLLATSAVAA